ncbi:MAG TPA: ClpXP protease specificity-enhancing factor [Porticoccaceae bacterium]|nr:ClpXP protease specificity-enhancing factor [Porticoccaceae bacterium]HCO60893.1 ClpXP protease specificity-enhancing factor [Porticoccaceae bacterium]
MTMSSNRPYLIRAFFDWIVDNDCTPHISVNAESQGVLVPQNYVQDGQIVLNIAPRAVAAFTIDDEGISFNGRFGGVPMDIYVPIDAVTGIYARENGRGMMFPPDEQPEPPPSSTPTGGEARDKGGRTKHGLRLVK